ncbi:MAG TPA: septum formation initiator family protein [Gemmatimonadota bacterium]|nr:septum formation initiator family protein [Gemmatimonadota bacterium]
MTRKRLADRRQRRRQKALFLGLALALVGYGVFVGDHRPWHPAMLWIEQGQTEERIDALKNENRELLGERQRLSDDDYALEQLAREKGMVRPGDMVYRIVPVPPGVRETVAESLAARAARQEAAHADSLRAEAAPPAPLSTP